MITPKTLKQTLTEAARFTAVAKHLQKILVVAELKGSGYGADGRANAAVRRASMDLTRALAELRRRQDGMTDD